MASSDSYEAIFGDAIAFVEQNSEQYKKRTATLILALTGSRDAIQAEYERLRDRVKETVMQSAAEPLDRHKCVACFMIALITALDISGIEKDPATPRLIKAAISIEIGISILITMIREDSVKNAQLIGFLNKTENEIALPALLCDDEDYLLNWARGLFYDNEDGCLSVLSLSNILFLIESFNCKCAEVDAKTKAETDNQDFPAWVLTLPAPLFALFRAFLGGFPYL